MSDAVLTRAAEATAKTTNDPALGRPILVALLASAGYFFTAKLGFAFALQPGPVSTLWMPNSILLAALLLVPKRSWWVVLLAAFPAHFVSEMQSGVPTLISLLLFLSNSVQALIAAFGISYFVREQLRFDRFRDLSVFVFFGAFLGPLVSSFLDIGTWNYSSYWEIWRIRFLSNVLAAITLIPVIVTWADADIKGALKASLGRWVEVGIITVGLFVVGLAVFSKPVVADKTAWLLYSPLPFLLWATVRFGPIGASTSVLLVMFMAIFGATHGEGPFVGNSSAYNALSIQGFLIVISVPLLALAAVIQERFRAEEAARGNEERLARTEDFSLVMVTHVGLDGRWLKVPPTLCELLGYSERELLAVKFKDVTHPEDFEAEWSQCQRLIRGEIRSFDLEKRYIHKDGHTIWVYLNCSVVEDDNGRPIHFVTYVRDITDRKLGEESLRQSEDRNHAILNALPDLMFLQSRDGTYLDYHASDPRQLYLSPSAFLGKNMREVLPPELAERLISCFESAEQTGEPQVLEYSVPIQGEERWYEARIVLSGGDKILSIVRDVTDRRRAGEELRGSEERFGKAFKANPQPMSLTTLADGCYLDVNESFLTISGYTREEVIGRTSLELGIWETPAARKEFIEGLKERGSVHNLETKFRTKSGSVRLLLSSAEQFELDGQHCVLVASSDITERRLAEELLRESEERLKQAISVARFGVFEHDHLTGILHSSPLTREIHAWGEGDTSSLEGIVAQLHPEDHEAFIAALLSAHDPAGDGFFALEYRIVRAGGKVRWVSARAQTFFEGEGGARHPVRTIGAEVDITERKRAEEALMESEHRFQLVSQATKDILYEWNLQTGVVWWNDSAMRSVFGYPLEEMRHDFNWWEERLHPEDKDRINVSVSEVLGGLEQKWENEYRFRKMDNSYAYVYHRAFIIRDDEGQALKVIGSLMDFTERKEAEEALLVSESRFRTMADSAPLLIWMCGPDKRCTYVNQGWLEFTGRTIEQELGSGWADGIFSEDYAPCCELFDSAFARREPFKTEYRLRRADGVFRWVYDTGIPRFSSEGEFLGYIGSCIDIADRKEAEEALRDLGGRLIHAQEEERSRVARELHDDLSQRIAVLSIGLEQIAQQIPEGPNNLHARIHGLWTESQEVSTELHRLSYQLHPSKLDHLGLVAAVRSFCEELAAHHEVTINFRHQGLPASLSKDITLCLFRIVQESLHNAVRHSGTREAQVVLEKTDHAVRLAVSDTGCGFDTESSKMTSGLGFISMRERLRVVGGQLSIRSRPFQGTQIEVTVPFVTHAEHASAGSSG